MCLIINKPADVIIPRKLIESAFYQNNDGWGVMGVAASGTYIECVKGMELETLLTTIEEFGEGRQYFVHFRMRTQGSVIIENNHPFLLGSSGIYMMHNGSLNVTPDNNVESDTAFFARMITPMLEKYPELLFTDKFTTFVNRYATSDRLIFLAPDGRYVKAGTGLWNAHKGLLLSNTYAWNFHYDVDWEDRPRDSYFNAGYSSRSSSSYPALLKTSQTSSTYFDFYGVAEDDDAEVTEDYDGKEPEYTMEQLQSMSYETLENIIWNDPSVAIRAIFESRGARYVTH